jgi:hypothetical protein
MLAEFENIIQTASLDKPFNNHRMIAHAKARLITQTSPMHTRMNQLGK